MKIVSLQQFRNRKRPALFEDLPFATRQQALQLLSQFCDRWKHDLPQWRYAILCGQARRLALNPPTSQWGRSMLAKRGGYAVQRLYRLEGRNPTARATHVFVSKRRSEAGRVKWLELE